MTAPDMAAQLRDALLERMRKTASGEMVAFDKRHVYEVLAVEINHVAEVRADDALRAGEVINSLKAEVATLKGAMAAQDERERLAGDQCGVPWQEHQCDWPDAVAEALIVSREREYPGYKREKALRCAAEAEVERLKAVNAALNTEAKDFQNHIGNLESALRGEQGIQFPDGTIVNVAALTYERDQLRAAVTTILTAVRDDEKGECWTIRRYLDERDIFNDDIQGSDRLVELACAHVLASTTGKEPPPWDERKLLHTIIQDCHALIDPEAYPDLAKRIDAVLLPCDEAGQCVPPPKDPNA